MNKIFNENYNFTLPKLSNIKMVITSPPDSEEIGLKPMDKEYLKFMENFVENITSVSNLICIVITDRKSNGIIPKHSILTYNFDLKGYRILSHKIWVKLNSINLFRLTYSHVMVFAKGKIKQKHNKEFEFDIWNIPHKKYNEYNNNFPSILVGRIMRNFTNKNDLIYDPFMGSGTTALVAKDEGRNYVGSELDKDIYNMCMKRLG